MSLIVKLLVFYVRDSQTDSKFAKTNSAASVMSTEKESCFRKITFWFKNYNDKHSAMNYSQ